MKILEIKGGSCKFGQYCFPHRDPEGCPLPLFSPRFPCRTLRPHLHQIIAKCHQFSPDTLSSGHPSSFHANPTMSAQYLSNVVSLPSGAIVPCPLQLTPEFLWMESWGPRYSAGHRDQGDQCGAQLARVACCENHRHTEDEAISHTEGV